jgi:transposase
MLRPSNGWRDGVTRRRGIEMIQNFGTPHIQMIAEQIAVSRATLYYWWNEYLKTGKLSPSRNRESKQWSCLQPDHLVLALQDLDQQPMLHIKELRAIIAEQTHGVLYSTSQIQHEVERAGYTRKVLEYKALEQSQPLRELYLARIRSMNTSQLIFVVETHADESDLRRRHGYCVRGQPAFVRVRNYLHGTGN